MEIRLLAVLALGLVLQGTAFLMVKESHLLALLRAQDQSHCHHSSRDRSGLRDRMLLGRHTLMGMSHASDFKRQR